VLLAFAPNVCAAGEAHKPTRIVSVNLCTDELLLRLADRKNIASVTWLAATSSGSNVADLATQIPTNHGLAEELIPLDPDLVVAGIYTARAAVALLKRTGIPVLDLDVPRSSEIRAQYRQVGQALGEEERAERVIAEMDTRLAAIPVNQTSPRPRAMAFNPNGYTIGKGTLADEIITRAGMENLSATLGIDKYSQISLETAVTNALDVLIVSADRDGPPAMATEMSIGAGETVGLIGPNGSGKTTLLRVLANLRQSDEGAVSYAGRSAAEIGARRLSQQIAYLAQGANVHWPMRIETLVGLGRLPHRRPMQSLICGNAAAVERAMVACDVVAFRDRTMSEVSGGERLRILLARALAVKAKILLADEPIAALDPLHHLQVIEVLRRTAREGRGVIVVLHDLALAARYCDRLVLLAGGSILAEGEPNDALTDAHIATAYGVDVVRGRKDDVPYLLPWLPVVATGRPSASSAIERTGKRDGANQ
jgi:iron complex transport system ATP-binding protein